MKKQLLFLISIMFYSSLYSQADPQYEKYLVNQSVVKTLDTEQCEKAKENVNKDAKNGNYNLITYGLIIRIDNRFHEFYSDFIKEKYSITIKDGGCIVSDYSECYTIEMRKLILKKYGNDIFIKAKKEAIEEYKKTAFFIKNIEPKITSNEVFDGNVQERPEYIYGKDSLRTYMRSKLFDFKTDKGYIRVNFIVEKNGSISNIELDENKRMNTIADEKAIKYIKLLKNWKPAKHFGEIVRVQSSLFFNLENKKYYTRDGKTRKK